MSEVRQIFVLNHSHLASDEHIAQAVAAIQKQVDFDFGPLWNCYASLRAVPRGTGVSASEWLIEVLDHSDQQGALGYHLDEGTPRGIVGVAECEKEGIPWSSCLSHEILEMLADPWAQLCYQVGSAVYSLEVCDATEAQGYVIDGVVVENFVLPDWFRPGSSGPWDKRGLLDGPLTMLQGGYSSTAELGQWDQHNSELVRASKKMPSMHSRRGRRRIEMRP